MSKRVLPTSTKGRDKIGKGGIVSEDTIVLSESEIAKSRSHVYHLLSLIYLSEITPELLNILTDKNVLDLFSDLGEDLGNHLNKPNHHELLNDLAEEYAALFIVPGGIPPYESVRLEGLLNQKSAFEVEEFYKKCGLIIKDDFTVMPDHIGMELEFMSYLANKEADSLINNIGDDAKKWFDFQKEFFEGHISRWAFRFLQDLEKFTFHLFYKGAARLTQRFLETEKEFLWS